MAQEAHACWRFLVSGLVQGVGYRKSVLGFVRSEHLVLKGHVMNLPDGRVEVLAQGSKTELDLLHEFCLKGPPRSRVDRVEITPEAGAGLELPEFDIKI
jgi:acylphosphatase